MPHDRSTNSLARTTDAAPAARLLSNGRYATLVSDAGGGFSRLGRFALTRWTSDRTRDADAFVVYVRDVASGAAWSAGWQPMRGAPTRYHARLGEHRVDLVREDERIESQLEIGVHPELDLEVRRLTLKNFDTRERLLEVTTYAEVVLNTPAGDASHPAFSKLFVQTDWWAEREALLAWRRLRSPDDEPLWLAHVLRVSGAQGAVEYETDRARFLGRARTTANPIALEATTPLSGTVGNVLDPMFAIRRVVRLAPGARVQLTAVLAAAATRETVERLVHRVDDDAVHYVLADRPSLDAMEPSLRAVADRVPALTGALVYGAPAMRDADAISRNRLPASRLSELGLRAPYLVVAHPTVDRESLDRTHALVEQWRSHGLVVDLVVVGAEHSLVAERVGERGPDVLGRTIAFIRDALGADDRMLLDAAAHLIVRDELPRLVPRPIAIDGAAHETPRERAPSRPAHHASDAIDFDNGIGGFSDDGREYVIRVEPDAGGHRLPPLPWVNVIANENGGCLISERGASNVWTVNSREHRITPWSNDPVSDPHGDAIWVRDDESGALWSPTPGPTPARDAYEVRHGFGYTRFSLTTDALEHDTWYFVPHDDAVRVATLRITNRGPRARRLSVACYAQLVLGGLPSESGRMVETWRDARTGALLAANRTLADAAPRVAVVSLASPNADVISATSDRTMFLGAHGDVASPAALASDAPFDERVGAGFDLCAALRAPVTLAPGETAEFVWVVGDAENESEARALAARYDDPAAARAALDDVRAFWMETLEGVRVETPSREIDLMVNGWLAYQNLSCRMWGRTAFYQSGGAFGFRDQLQDSSALVYLDPHLTRSQIVLHAAHQFVEGDVLHWWHPPASRGMRTRFSDDLLWLPYITSFYLHQTGDATVLDESARFVTARQLEAREDEVYLTPRDSQQRATVYEHCCRSLDRSLTSGAHGLPLMGVGDWNDGMNRVGREGRGESVWLGFFLYEILDDFIPIARARGDDERANRYDDYRVRLAAALDDAGWDGAWYRRAYYDDGAPLGAATNDECRIDAIAQAWSVISGVASPKRAESALEAMEQHLVSERDGIIRLLTPAFDKTTHDPGYIKGYLPGVRENGGQYTHGALWAVRALAEAGYTERAAPLLTMLSPVAHGRTPEEIAVYKTEPYVIAADVYGVEPHIGRGGWTWYTGSAGWMFRVALESVLGFTIVGGNAIELRPCIPDAWPGFSIRYRVPGERTSIEIVVARAARGATTSIVLDGTTVPLTDGLVRIPLPRGDGAIHRADILLGADAAPRYRASARGVSPSSLAR